MDSGRAYWVNEIYKMRNVNQQNIAYLYLHLLSKYACLTQYGYRHLNLKIELLVVAAFPLLLTVVYRVLIE
jgi:hypothetical protein